MKSRIACHCRWEDIEKELDRWESVDQGRATLLPAPVLSHWLGGMPVVFCQEQGLSIAWLQIQEKRKLSKVSVNSGIVTNMVVSTVHHSYATHTLIRVLLLTSLYIFNKLAMSPKRQTKYHNRFWNCTFRSNVRNKVKAWGFFFTNKWDRQTIRLKFPVFFYQPASVRQADLTSHEVAVCSLVPFGQLDAEDLLRKKQDFMFPLPTWQV